MMWGWWDSGSNAERPNWLRYAIIALVIAMVIGLLIGTRFGGWWFFFLLFPLFGGMGRSRRRERHERRRYAPRSADDKLKNDEWDEDYEEEKPKRAEYRIGDDGELVEVEPERDERQYVPRQSARRVNGDDQIEYI